MFESGLKDFKIWLAQKKKKKAQTQNVNSMELNFKNI